MLSAATLRRLTGAGFLMASIAPKQSFYQHCQEYLLNISLRMAQKTFRGWPLRWSKPQEKLMLRLVTQSESARHAAYRVIFRQGLCKQILTGLRHKILPITPLPISRK